MYVDAENRQEHSTGKLVTVLETEKNSDIYKSKALPEIGIICGCQSHTQLLNDHEDPSFFTAAFPMLFPFRIGSHLAASRKQKIDVSLATWA